MFPPSSIYLRAVIVSLLICLWHADAMAGKLLLNGLAPRHEFSEVVFYGALYTEQRHADSRQLLSSQEDKAIEIRIAKDIYYPRRWQRHWMEAIAINAGDAEVQKHAATLADFLSLIDFKLIKGDTFRLERSAGKVTASLNGKRLAQYADAHFIDLLLRVWVGPVPISSVYKDSVLAAGQADATWLAEFNALQPGSSRLAETERLIAAAGAPPASSSAAPSTSQPAAPQPTRPQPTSAPPVAAASPPAPGSSRPAAAAKPAPAPAVDPERAASTTLASAAPVAIAPGARREPAKPPVVTSNSMEADLNSDAGGFRIDASSLLAHKRYVSELIIWTGRFAKYPKRALNRGREGTVRVAVTIDQGGAIQSSRIVEEAEHDELNSAAMTAISAASPYPAIPANIGGERYTFTVPVVFKIGSK